MMPSQNNYDQSELNKFSHGAGAWWDNQGEFKTLHDINPVRLDYISSRCRLSGSHVIDVGCGGGILSESLAANAETVTGIDLNEAAIQAAREHNRCDNLTYVNVATSEYAKSNRERFDILTCMELLEHVPEPWSLVADCSELVKPGGHLFFSTINRNLSAYLQLIIAAENLLHMLPRGTHDYGKFIKPSELVRWCRQCGLAIQDISGMTYSPVTRRYHLSDSPRVNYLAHAIKSEN